MDRLTHKTISSRNRANRTRSNIFGSSERPRLSVHISNTHVSAQIIDDNKKSTLVYVTTVGQKIEGNLTMKAAWVGKEIASKSKKAKIKKVVFDRGPRKYHGRVKSLADAARAEGMEF